MKRRWFSVMTAWAVLLLSGCSVNGGTASRPHEASSTAQQSAVSNGQSALSSAVETSAASLVSSPQPVSSQNRSSSPPASSVNSRSSVSSKPPTGVTDAQYRDSYHSDDQYLVFFLTNTSVSQAGSYNGGRNALPNTNFVSELPLLFGELNASSKQKYAFGLPGPMLLTQSTAQMQQQVNAAFDLAERYNVPVYFQLDDCNNYTTEFGSAATPKYYQNPAWCEWTQFPSAEEQWGNQSNGRLPYFWFNWGAWMHAQAFPCFESPGFRTFVTNQLKTGVLEPLMNRYRNLRNQGKEYLFAGMAIGWETHIPDYSSDNPLLGVSSGSLPTCVLTGDKMQSWEARKYGFNALKLRGQTTYNREILYDVIHDYSELLAKTAFEAGVPRRKIFTHIVGITSSDPSLKTTFTPPIRAAVNDYSIPGFTLSPVTCPYDIGTLLSEIKKADPGQIHFANAEGYARGVDGSYSQAKAYFTSQFSNNAYLVSVFGWGRETADSAFAVSHSKSSPFVQAASDWLQGRY